MKKFESKNDLLRESKAIEAFCNKYLIQYVKLNDWDIDFLVHRDNNFVTYAEVKGRNRNISDCFPLPLAVRKIHKLCESCADPVIIWAMYDGIAYAKLRSLEGVIKTGGRKPRAGSSNDIEPMAYYDKQNEIKFIRYEKH